MREAVIVSTARSPIGRAYRGAFNNTPAQTLGAHAIRAAVLRAGVDPAEIDDVIMGCAMQQGAQGGNVARQSALRAGLPVTVPAQSVDRQCASGLMAVAMAVHGDVDGCVTAIRELAAWSPTTKKATPAKLNENCASAGSSLTSGSHAWCGASRSWRTWRVCQSSRSNSASSHGCGPEKLAT